LTATIIRKALTLESIPIYGDGQNILDLLYNILDHCCAIEKVFVEGRSGETYLIGGHNEETTIEIAETICTILDEVRPISGNEKGLTSYQQLIEFVQDRHGHDFRYAIKMIPSFRRNFGGHEVSNFKECLWKTVQYYIGE